MKRWILGLALLAPLLGQSQTFPSKLVKIQVPFSSSGGPTVFMQVLADKLSKAWGERVIVEPKPRASGFLAIESVKHAAPHGHQVLIRSESALALQSPLYQKLPSQP